MIAAILVLQDWFIKGCLLINWAIKGRSRLLRKMRIWIRKEVPRLRKRARKNLSSSNFPLIEMLFLEFCYLNPTFVCTLVHVLNPKGYIIEAFFRFNQKALHMFRWSPWKRIFTVICFYPSWVNSFTFHLEG